MYCFPLCGLCGNFRKQKPKVVTMMRKTISRLIWIVCLLQISASAQTSRNQLEYLSPRPESIYHLPQTTIVLRPGETFAETPADLGNRITVSGSLSGPHSGDAIIATDNRTIIFKPHAPFQLGEQVTVSVSNSFRSASGEPLHGLSYRFRIAEVLTAKTSNLEILQKELALEAPAISTPVSPAMEPTSKTGGFSLPADLPVISVTANDNPSAGNIFLANLSWGPNPPRPYHLLMLDNSGYPVFFSQTRSYCRRL